MKVTVSAPGKVVILGEYAVLEGAPALVMAVDRRVRVTLSSRPDGDCSISAPGWVGEPGLFRLGESGPEWRGVGEPKLALATQVVNWFFARQPRGQAREPFDLLLDSGELSQATRHGDDKLGLGSSAALTVALSHALGYYVASHQPGAEPPGLGELIAVHSDWQGRRGSGLDIAASLYGGLVEFQLRDGPQARAWTLPGDLSYCFVWSNRSAATSEFLATLDHWRRREPGCFEALIQPLMDLAEAGSRAARQDQGGEFLRSMDLYTPALERLGKAAGVDILSEPHRRLWQRARRYGVTYKPCGAGGGDIGVAMSSDREALARFQGHATADGFKLLSIANDQSGGVMALPEN